MNRTEALRGAAIEALELRRLLSVTIDSAGVVRGVGTSGADVLRIEQPSETAIRVTVNAQTATFDTEDVTAILLQGLGGNDAFEERLFPDSTIPVTHEGGDGNDDFDVYRTNTVRGGAGNDQVDVILPDGNIPAEYDGGSGVDGISIGLNHFLDLNRFPTVENASA